MCNASGTRTYKLLISKHYLYLKYIGNKHYLPDNLFFLWVFLEVVLSGRERVLVDKLQVGPAIQEHKCLLDDVIPDPVHAEVIRVRHQDQQLARQNHGSPS